MQRSSTIPKTPNVVQFGAILDFIFEVKVFALHKSHILEFTPHLWHELSSFLVHRCNTSKQTPPQTDIQIALVPNSKESKNQKIAQNFFATFAKKSWTKFFFCSTLFFANFFCFHFFPLSKSIQVTEMLLFIFNLQNATQKKKERQNYPQKTATCGVCEEKKGMCKRWKIKKQSLHICQQMHGGGKKRNMSSNWEHTCAPSVLFFSCFFCCCSCLFFRLFSFVFFCVLSLLLSQRNWDELWVGRERWGVMREWCGVLL